MSLRLQGYNFEGFPELDITIDHFTCITGKGHSGKSSVVRALRALLLNDFDEERIRDDAKECLLRVTFEGEPHEVLQIERKKSKRVNSYEITLKDGTVRNYPKSGKVAPAELEEIGFSLMKTEAGDEHDLSFHQQFDDTLFLLQLRDASTSSFVNTVYGLNQEEAGLRRMIADSADVRQRYDHRAKEIIAIERELSQAEEAEVQAGQRREALAAAISVAEEATVALERLQRGAAMFARVAEIEIAVRERAEIAEAGASARDTLAALRDLLTDNRRARALRADLALAKDQIQRQTALADQAQRLLPPVRGLRDSLRTLRESVQRRDRAVALHSALEEAQVAVVAAASRRADGERMFEAVQRWSTSLRTLARREDLRADLKAATANYDAATARVATGMALLEQIRALHVSIGQNRSMRLRRRDRLAVERDLDRLRGEVDRANSVGGALHQVVDALRVQARMAAQRERWRLQAEAVRSAKATREVRMAELEAVHACESQVLGLIGSCPTCHKPLTKEHAHG